MTAQLRSELFKQRTTRTTLGLVLAMVVLVAAVILLHVVALPTQGLTGRQGQLKVLGLGTTFGMIFGSLLGALSITTEIRNGMIRPTLLATPNRSRVVAAKVMACLIAGAALGLLSEAIAVGVGAAGLAARGIQIAPSVGDFAQLLVGGAAAAALWAAIGVGIGATLRNQVGAAISLVVWLLFIEMTVIGVAPAVGKFLPGASGGALAGAMLQETATYLLVPAVGALLMVAYAVVAIGAGLVSTARRDIN
ncbi:MAG: ABC transporter permease [Candidatus Dormibacteria bacterium]